MILKVTRLEPADVDLMEGKILWYQFDKDVATAVTVCLAYKPI